MKEIVGKIANFLAGFALVLFMVIVVLGNVSCLMGPC